VKAPVQFRYPAPVLGNFQAISSFYMLENENKLIKQAQKGQAEPFGLLYDHYCPRIYRFVFLKTSDKEKSEDLTHEVFLSAWQNIGNYNDRGYPFSSWLYQIARNRVIDHYRTRKEITPIDSVDEAVLKVAPAWDNILDRRMELERVKKAIALLNEDQQTIIILRYIEEMTPAEIADVLNKSEGAVRLMQHRSINKLREILETENGQLA
jgi:RNA polymerase sigma-70 factor, ECF subfamily